MPPGVPPPFSCRSGLSVLLGGGVGGGPAAGGYLPEMVPFRLGMKRRSWLDEVYHVVTLQQVSVEEVSRACIFREECCLFSGR